MKYLKLEVKDYVATVTYDKPPANAIDADVYNEFRAMFDGLNVRDDVRVVILRAEGRFFAPGNDVSAFQAFTPMIIDSYLDLVKSGIGAIYACKHPVIGVVQGHALGAGLAVAAVCDFIISAPEVPFGIPEIKVGIIGAAEFADLIVPRKVVNYMALTGNPVTAEQIHAWGGIHKIVPEDQLMDAAMELANELLGNGPIILRYFKEALQRNLDARLIEKYNVEGSYTTRYLTTEDFMESSAAFLEKRKPVYKGR
jgi:enoyl-CoA hydratase